VLLGQAGSEEKEFNRLFFGISATMPFHQRKRIVGEGVVRGAGHVESMMRKEVLCEVNDGIQPLVSFVQTGFWFLPPGQGYL